MHLSKQTNGTNVASFDSVCNVIKYQLNWVCSRKHNIPATLFSPEKSIVLLARFSLGLMVWCDVLICGWARERSKKRIHSVFSFCERFYLERMSATCYATDFISFHFVIVIFILVQWNRYAIENAQSNSNQSRSLALALAANFFFSLQFIWQ